MTTPTAFPPFACTLTGDITNDPQLLITDLTLRMARAMDDNKIATYQNQIAELRAFQDEERERLAMAIECAGIN